MSAFAAAVGALFADPNIGRDAVYIADGGAPVLVRVVARRADVVSDFGDARLWSETTRIDLRVAEVANPRPGDRIEIAGDAFLIQGEPVRDRERLVWTVGAKVYWDDTNNRCTTVATDNTLIGVAVEAVASGAGDTIGRVRLNAAF